MDNLKKIFVSVSDSNVANFISTYITPASGVERNSNYDNKIVFLGNTGKIFTRGNVYGIDNTDFNAIKDILDGFGTGEGKTATVSTAIGGLDSRIKAIETLIEDNTGEEYITAAEYTALEDKTGWTLVTEEGENKGKYVKTTSDVIDRVSEVLKWFKDVSDSDSTYKVTVGTDEVELGVGQAGLLTTVAEAKQAIGKANTAADGETSNATGLYKEIEDAKSANNAAIESLNGSGTVKDGNNNISLSYTQTNGKVSVTDLSAYYVTSSYSDATDGTAYYTIAEGTDSYIATGSNIAYAVAYVNASISYAYSNAKAYTENVINSLTQTAYTAFDDDNLIQVTYSQSNGLAKIDSVSVNTKILSTAVGMKKNEEGKWVAADGNITNDGLVIASDVASEIVADEQVIAGALNDHESRIVAMETGDNSVSNQISTAIGELNTTSNQQAVSYVNNNGVVTLTFNGIKETSGIISAGDGTNSLTLSKVATTGSATDVATTAIVEDDDTVGLPGTNVADQISYIGKAIKSAQTAASSAHTTVSYTGDNIGITITTNETTGAKNYQAYLIESSYSNGALTAGLATSTAVNAYVAAAFDNLWEII